MKYKVSLILLFLGSICIALYSYFSKNRIFFAKKFSNFFAAEAKYEKECTCCSIEDVVATCNENHHKNDTAFKKISTKVQTLELQLSQTQKKLNDVVAKQSEQYNLLQKRLDNVNKEQKQTLDKVSKVKKDYVKERVRCEIADEIIKQHLMGDEH